METVTRRSFLLGAAGVIAAIPTHHRPWHAGGPKPSPSPSPTPTPTPGVGVYLATYEDPF